MRFFFTSRAAGGDDDAGLPARLARGERGALEAVYRREAAAVYRYALAWSGNAAWAADATQDAFVALAARPHGWDPARGTLGAYLAGSARHALAARWREQRLLDPLADDDAAIDAGSSEAADAPLLRAEASAAVWAALRALPLAQCEAVVLVDLQQRPYAEAAAIAGTELNTLRTRLHRARARLATLLAAQGATP